MSAWGLWRPGDGDLDGLSSAASVLRGSVDQAVVCGTEASRVASTVHTVWTGPASEAWSTALAAAAARAATLGDVAQTTEREVRNYVAEVEGVRDTHAKAVWRMKDVCADAARAGASCTFDLDTGRVECVETAGHSGGGVWRSSVAGPQLALVGATAFEMRLTDELLVIAELAERRRELDRSLRDTVLAAIPSGWSARRATFEAAGVTDPTEMTPRTYAVLLADRVVEVGGEPLTPADAQELSAFLADHSADRVAMDAFFRELGGAGAVRLSASLETALDDSHRDRDLSWQLLAELGIGLRDGLAAASVQWGSRVADPFARDMMAVGEPGAVAFLLSGPPFVGAALAAAVAREVDVAEREGRSLPASGHTDLGQMAWGRSTFDLAGRAFESLGAHPQQAADFLDDPADGRARIEYWFADRSWIAADWEGPLALWDGAQRATGGPAWVPPDGVWDVDALEAAAGRNSRIFDALSRNTSFQAESVSDRASVALAGALAPDLLYQLEPLQFAEAYEQSDLGDKEKSKRRAGGVVEVSPFWADGVSRPVPLVGWDAYAHVVGVAGSRTGGASVLDATARTYTDRLWVVTGHDELLFGKATQRVVAMDGFVTGAVDKAEIGVARRVDERVARDVAAVQALVSSIPFPGPSGLVARGMGQALSGPAAWMVDGGEMYGLGSVLTAAGQQAQSTNELEALLATRSTRDAARDAMEQELLRAAMDVYGMGDPPPFEPDDDDSEWNRTWAEVLVKQGAVTAQTIEESHGQWMAAYGYGRLENPPPMAAPEVADETETREEAG